jgi:hypothetical protein
MHHTRFVCIWEVSGQTLALKNSTMSDVSLMQRPSNSSSFAQQVPQRSNGRNSDGTRVIALTYCFT